MLAPDEIADRYASLRERVDTAVRRARRDASTVRIVLASKANPPEAIAAAHAAGARDFGENYVQEAARKQDALTHLEGLRWHLIGHLQTNKARNAANRFVLIHSLDSARLASALANARPTPPMPVLIEVNLAAEPTKTGIAAEFAERLIHDIRGRVEVLGLMTIPLLTADPAHDSRRYFAALRAMRDRLAALTGLALEELSMGMTDDFEIAIEEGATMIRVGRAVFGERIR